MPETITLQKLNDDLHLLRMQFANFRDQAIVEIARLQVLLAPSLSAVAEADHDNTALLEREQALRQTLGLPMRDRDRGY
jgi:hypothetical protein